MLDSKRLQTIRDAASQGHLCSAALENLMNWAQRKDYASAHDDISRLVDAGDWSLLDDSFAEVLPFGTGGRRGPMGPGPNRVNDRTIGESAQGLAAYIAKAGERPAGKRFRVVIAYDTRNGSREFADLAADIFAGNGFEAHVFTGPRSTPELSFAVRSLNADAGVVISASHNPPSDNGFKAYWSDGGQVVAPHDKGIIEEVVRVRELKSVPTNEARERGLRYDIGENVDRAYVDYVAGMCLGEAREIDLFYTPMHGTGTTSIWPALKKAGFTSIHRVDSQWSADGDFPGVPDQMPNPEIPRAMEAGVSDARKAGGGIVLGSDPDADRLGVYVVEGGEATFLTGNQIGALLLDHVLEGLASSGRLPDGATAYKTLVTSDLIDRLCESRGVRVDGDLLVGFKYVAAKIRDMGDPSKFVFATEESHGYLCGAEVRDKDAAQAAVLLAERAAASKARGRTLLDDLDEIYSRHGYYRELTRSMTFQKPGKGDRGIGTMRALMKSLRSDPPKTIGGETIVSVVDRADGTVRDPASGRVTDELDVPRGDVLVFRLSENGGERVSIRPSGTEPKIKVYIQLHGKPGEDLAGSRRTVDARAEALMTDMEKMSRDRTRDI